MDGLFNGAGALAPDAIIDVFCVDHYITSMEPWVTPGIHLSHSLVRVRHVHASTEPGLTPEIHRGMVLL